MARKLLPLVFALLSVAVVGSIAISQASAEIPYHGPKDLFHNYYVAPEPGVIGAELYVSPRPAPASSGHTYITYPPLMPHEFLYKHHRTYKTKHTDAPATKTKVRWR